MSVSKSLSIDKVANKEDRKDPLLKLIERNPCKKCQALKLPTCKCSGPVGCGKGGKTDNQSDGAKPAFEETLKKKKNNKEELILDGIEPTPTETESLEHLQEELLLSLEEILQLTFFNNDSERGILTIRARPGLSSDERQEVQQLIDAIKIAFDQFKHSLEQQGISTEHFICDLNDNHELVIRIPSPKYYDAFIQQLTAQKLLPVEVNPEQSHQSTLSGLTPLAINLMPLSNSKKDEEDDEQLHYSPFSTQLKR